SKVNHNINWIRRLLSVLPKADLHIEVGKFDLQKMKNPAINSEGYQQGDLYGYKTVKQFVLARDNYTSHVFKIMGCNLKINNNIYFYLGRNNYVNILIT